jgi:hypothetical protein
VLATDSESDFSELKFFSDIGGGGISLIIELLSSKSLLIVLALPFSTAKSLVEGISTDNPNTASRNTRRFLL